MGDESNQKLIDGEYKESRYRWVNLGIYLLAGLVNSLPTQTFTSINTIVNSVVVTLNVLLFSILNPVFAFPVNWILDKFGIKIGCSLGGILLIIGVWLRTIISQGTIVWCIFGTVFCAIGCMFILSSSSILGNNWFKPAVMPVIIFTAVTINLISGASGSAIAGLMVKQVKGNEAETQQNVINFLRLEAIIVTIPFVILLIGFKNRPNTPPSKSAENKLNISQNYSQSLKKLFKNPQYIKCIMIIMFSYGGALSYLANLDQMLNLIGIKNSGQMTGQIILACMLAGLASSVFLMRKVKTTLQYKSVLVACLLVTVLMDLVSQIIMARKPTEAWVAYMIGILTGTFKIPITAVLLAYASEAFYPIGQGSSNGYLIASSKTFGFVFGLGSAALLQSAHNQDKTKTTTEQIWKVYLFMAIHILTTLIAFVIALTTKNQLNRTQFELNQTQQKQAQQRSIVSSAG